MLLFTWFANPALWAGACLLALGHWRGAALAGTLAVLLALVIALPSWPPMPSGASPSASRAPAITVVHRDGAKTAAGSPMRAAPASPSRPATRGNFELSIGY
jgi:hypothetical protein